MHDKANYYWDIAQSLMERGTCPHGNSDAVTVLDNEIVSAGYSPTVLNENGISQFEINSTDLNNCIQDDILMFSEKYYEFYEIVHVETAAIASCSHPRELLSEATLYLVGGYGVEKKKIF